MSYELADSISTGAAVAERPQPFGDQGRVWIRPLAGADEALETAFMERLSFEARRYRFVGQMADSEGFLALGLGQFDFERDTSFAAVLTDDAGTRIVGIARYSLDAAGGRCECAVTIADAWREPGLELLLMRRLVQLARARGIRSLYSIDAVGNVAMRELAEQLGFQRRPHPVDPALCVHRLRL